MRKLAKAENSMMLSATTMPHASAEEMDELFNIRFLRSSGADMAAAGLSMHSNWIPIPNNNSFTLTPRGEMKEGLASNSDSNANIHGYCLSQQSVWLLAKLAKSLIASTHVHSSVSAFRVQYPEQTNWTQDSIPRR